MHLQPGTGTKPAKTQKYAANRKANPKDFGADPKYNGVFQLKEDNGLYYQKCLVCSSSSHEVLLINMTYNLK